MIVCPSTLDFPLYPLTLHLHLRVADGGVEKSRFFEASAARTANLPFLMKQDAIHQNVA
jgi:hypothetical protein